MLRFDHVTPDAIYTISELSARFGLTSRTLRFYEERGLLRPSRYGYLRLYSENDRIHLEVILKAKRLGFSLAAIREILEARARETKSNASGSNDLGLSTCEIEEQIRRLTVKQASVVDAIAELSAALAARDNDDQKALDSP